MYRRVLLVVTMLLLLPALVLAQDGKLRGRILDRESNEPLIGASVVIDATTLGASADINGDYIVLSVPPGAYTVKVSYIGYQTLSVSNVRVNANLTTTQDFMLASTAVEVAGMEIVAERPLVQRNTTNTMRLTTQEDIENLPIRGTQNIIALNAGTVLQNGALHVRGGRKGEVGFFVDGATAINPYNNEENVSVIQEAVEEIQLQSGGYTAEFGGANSGIVSTAVRSGSSEYKMTLDYRTDDFAKPGEQFLGTTAFGFRNGVVTLSGPIMNKLKFFVAGQHNYIRDRSQRYMEPFEFTGLVTDPTQGNPIAVGSLLPENGTVKYERNYVPDNSRRDNTVQGTLSYDLSKSLKFRFTGSYNAIENQAGRSWPNSLTNYFQLRDPLAQTKTALGNLKITHVLNPKTFYEAALYYSNRSFKQFDETFGDNWQAYSDSIANANAGFGDFISRWEGPPQYKTINSFAFDHPNAPINTFFKNSQEDLGFSLDFTTQASKTWEVKVGGRFDRWNMRQFNVNNIQSVMTYLYGRDGRTVRQFESDLERRVQMDRQGTIDRYGYDVDGNKLDSGLEGPRNPTFLSMYVQNKLEYRDLVVNFGLRYERIATDALGPANLESPEYDPKLNYLLDDQFVTVGAEDYFLPRVNFSFPVTDKTVFYATYGKYVQMSQLTDVYGGNRRLNTSVVPITRSAYGTFGQWVGFTAKPERSTQYEMGIRQSLTDNFALTVTGFYKDLRDQLRFDRVLADGTDVLAAGSVLFSGLVNNDIATIKGLETTLELRRTKRLAAKLNYTIASTRGTGSDSRATRVAVSDGGARYPLLIYPLNHNQPHRGSLVMDYRWAQGDGGAILQGVGLNAIFNFSSGHSYTQIKEPSNLGQSNPWNVGIRPLLDARNSNPTEPINTSQTPWNFNIDFTLGKNFRAGGLGMEVYAIVLNLLDNKNVINVYPSTGTAEDDGWLRSPLAASFVDIPNYVEFYNAINQQNRWAYGTVVANGTSVAGSVAGNDLYGVPRQIQLGLKIEL
ncbi:MAG: TonB-dependent receptor [bacterium]